MPCKLFEGNPTFAMGSSTSKSKQIRNTEVNSQGFPRRGSIKSIASIMNSSDGDSFGVLSGSMKSVSEKSFPSYAVSQSRNLQKTVNDQTKLITELKKVNNDLQNDVKDLRKQLYQLKLGASVAETSRNQQTHTYLDFENGNKRNLPKIGDHVVAMWGQSKFQYFTATIEQFDTATLKYTIEWDDHDPTGRVVDYFNLAVDQVPSNDQIGVGSKVLFHQGKYKEQEVHGIIRSGGFRWHEGEIDAIFTDIKGIKFYNGHHTKGQADGKWVTYKDYSQSFTGYKIDDFRMPPNVFDILSSIEPAQQAEENDVDVYVSYAKINCPSAISGKEIDDTLPPSYEESVLQTMCDPRNIVSRLINMGLRVFVMENEESDALIHIVNALEKAKVFIACLSDEYASNDRCRMEFQYAKNTKKLPVIPLVVGTGSFQWQMTVVGMLCAGELYIHFKNTEVEELKMTELARTIKNFVPEIKIQNVQHAATGNAIMEMHSDPHLAVTGKPLVTGKADMFFSYCWNNSNDALTRREIDSCSGVKLCDPRLICQRLTSQVGLSAWIDIERLKSASGGFGMFAQIASAVRDCKVVVACISLQYANSNNCRMELQFAAQSLHKPVVALIVGEGSKWKETNVGKMVTERYPLIDMQDLETEEQLGNKINGISSIIQKELKMAGSSTVKFRAPVSGDHVVCLHQNWAYFMATVVSFNADDMTYTVDWDDKDPTGRVQSYENVALDEEPADNLIEVGTTVLFGQGDYSSNDNNSGGVRYHQGKITNIYRGEDGVIRYDGEHTKDSEDGKWVTFRGYLQRFKGKLISDLRLSPNAMDALMATKEAFKSIN